MNTNQKLPSLPMRVLASFIPNMVLLGAAAAIFGTPVQSRYFPELAADNPNVILLLGGSLLMSLLLALLYPYLRIEVGKGWLDNALPIAILLGITIYFATHIVQAGYTTVSPTGWLLEGLYDSLAPFGSILGMAWLTNRQNR